MRRIICISLSIIFCLFSVCAIADASEGIFRNIHWKFEKGVLSFSGSGWLDVDDGPWIQYRNNVSTLEFSGQELSVFCIFRKYNKVSTVHIGKGVKETGDSVFSETANKLKLIIDENDFQLNPKSFNCTKVSEIVLGEDVDNFALEDGLVLNKNKDRLLMYYGKKKDVVVVPETVKTLSEYVFLGNQMKEIVLPDGLETLEDSSLAYCPNLQQITVPASVKTVGASVFDGDKKLKSLNFISLAVKADYKTMPDLFSNMDSLKTLVIPNYGDIGEITVAQNKSLSTIIVSEGNTDLDGSNGNLIDTINNSKLSAVYLPKSLTEIGYNNLYYSSRVTLYVIMNSYAHKFAVKNGFSFVLVKPIRKISLSAEELETHVGKQIDLKAEVFPNNSTVRDVEWMSSNERVAKVQNGRIRAVGEGECDILCRGLDCGGITATCHIVVTK